jgi:hypothetical protein
VRAKSEGNCVPRRAGFHRRLGFRRLDQSAVHFHHACGTRLNRAEFWLIADMRDRSASAVDQIDEKLVSFRFLTVPSIATFMTVVSFARGSRCDSPQEPSEPVNHFPRHIRHVPSRRRRFLQKGSGFVVRSQQLNCGMVINCPSNRNILQGSDVFLLRSQAAS